MTCMKSLLAVMGVYVVVIFTGPAAASEAHQILQEAGVRGGLVVHLGCGNGELTAAFVCFKNERRGQESFGDFCHRVGKDHLLAQTETIRA